MIVTSRNNDFSSANETFLRSIILIATCCPVILFVAEYTVEYAPLPNYKERGERGRGGERS
jgi:hypothetical protein